LEAQKAIMYEGSQKLLAENTSLCARIQDLEARGDRDKEEISWAAQTRSQMEEERNDLLARNAELEGEVNRLEKEMGYLNDEVSKVNNELGRAKEELNRVTQESEGVSRERDVVIEKVNRVKEELERLAQTSQEAEAEKRTIDGELGQVKEELNGVSGRLERAEQEKELVIAELGQVREDLERANEEVYALRTALDQADEKLEQSEATWQEETGSLRAEKVRLESAIGVANSWLEEVGRDLEERKGHIIDVETRLQEMQEELGRVVEENGKLRATLSGMQQNVEVHKKEAETHRADAERAAGDCTYLKERSRKLEEENNRLKQERAQSAEQIRVLSNDLEAHRAELARLQAVEEMSGQQIGELKAALDGKQASVEELESRVASLMAELQTAGAFRQHQPSAETPVQASPCQQPSQAGVRQSSELTSQDSANHFRDVHVDSMVVSKTDQRPRGVSQEWAASAELREAQLEGALEQARRDYELLLKGEPFGFVRVQLDLTLSSLWRRYLRDRDRQRQPATTNLCDLEKFLSFPFKACLISVAVVHCVEGEAGQNGSSCGQ
jgi:chromosome segregation ATPase